MNLSATAPTTVHIERRHLVGLAIVMAVIVAGLTWALVVIANDRSSAPAPATPVSSEQVLASLDPSARQFVQGVVSQSPAALAAAYGRAPVSAPAPTTATSARAAEARELSEIAKWAKSEGLVGQSPASLHPVP